MFEYNATTILADPGSPAAIRRRPAMYIGGCGTDGVHALLLEVLANAVDEHLAGSGGEIAVGVEADGTISVEDGGRGLPLAPGADGAGAGVTALTTLHSGPTADGHRPHVHLYAGGIGLAVVNALSDRLEVESRREGAVWRVRGSRGALEPAERIGEQIGEQTGTRVRFRPDPDIFGAAQVDAGWLRTRLREVAALFAGLRLRLSMPGSGEQAFRAPEGVRSLLGEPGQAPPAPLLEVAADGPDLRLRAALGWSAGRAGARRRSWVNGQPVSGGTHISGLLQGLSALERMAAEAPGAEAPGRPGAGLRDHLVAAVAVWLEGAEFAGPQRERLENPEVREAVRQAVAARIARFIAEEPEAARALTASISGPAPAGGRRRDRSGG